MENNILTEWESRNEYHESLNSKKPPAPVDPLIEKIEALLGNKQILADVKARSEARHQNGGPAFN